MAESSAIPNRPGRLLVLHVIALAACVSPDPSAEPAGGSVASVHVIRDSLPSCGGCSIEMTRLVSLGSEADSVLLTRTPVLARDSRGRTIASVRDRGFEPVLIYRPDGTLERTLGGQGQGPGEHTRVEAIVVTEGDSIVLAHSFLRFSVFAPDGRYVRGGSLPTPPYEMIPIPDGGFIISGTMATAQTFGLPLHRVSADGALVRSFGTENIFPPEGPPFRALAPRLVGTTFWLSERKQYRLERVDTLGRVTRVIAVVTPWWFVFSTPAEFQAYEDSTRPPDPSRPFADPRPPRLRWRPPFGIASIVPDSAGRLWVAHHTHVSDWDKLDAEYERGTSEVRLADDMKGRMFRTVLDVIDPERGALLARRIVPGYGWIANDGTFIHMQYRENGIVAIDVSRLRLQGLP